MVKMDLVKHVDGAIEGLVARIDKLNLTDQNQRETYLWLCGELAAYRRIQDIQDSNNGLPYRPYAKEVR